VIVKLAVCMAHKGGSEPGGGLRCCVSTAQAPVLPANGRVKLALTLPMFRMTPDRRLTMSLPAACMVAERRYKLAYA